MGKEIYWWNERLTSVASLMGQYQYVFQGFGVKRRLTVSVTPPTALPAVLAVPDAASRSCKYICVAYVGRRLRSIYILPILSMVLD